MRIGHTVGMMYFGVKTEQSVVDAAVLQYLLFQTKTDLLVELGTYCGGSSVYYAKMMRDYNPNATVITVDISDPKKGWCGTRRAAGAARASCSPLGGAASSQ